MILIILIILLIICLIGLHQITLYNKLIKKLGFENFINGIYYKRFDEIGFKPEIPLEEGLKRTIQWYESSQN